MNKKYQILAVAIAVVALAGCKTKKVVDPVEPTRPVAQQPSTTPAAGDPWTDASSLDTVPCLRARTISFDFDSSNVSGQFDEMIGCHAKWLMSNPGARLTLEGNADERGTREYNLGLGERRGNGVNDMLTAKGASSSQITVVSYGEERPVCTESSDDCWARNRRVELVYTQKQ